MSAHPLNSALRFPAIILHYLVSLDRIAWLVKQK